MRQEFIPYLILLTELGLVVVVVALWLLLR